MRQEEIDSRLRQIFASLFQVAPENIHDSLARGEFGPWDSLQHLNLVLAIEEEFQIQLQPEQIEAMKSFGSIREIIGGYVGETNDS